MTVAGLKRKFDALDTDKIITETMVESSEMLADLNVEQLSKGLKSDGSPMPDYSQVSVEFYGKPDGPIVLKDTGAFYAGFYVKIEGEKVVPGSTDSKSDKLFADYPGIGGLSEKFKSEAIRDKIRPTLKKKMTAATGLKFG